MRWSNCYIPTLKEAPADAEVVSHKLLTRAGMVRKLTSGIYIYLPLGLKAIEKTAAIVREEMNRAGALELSMPMVQPADLWQESGRWEFYGKELLRFQDRNGRDYCLGPTHEEVITDLVRGEVRSYRQLPINLYQIQTKFRDEIRPRFGLMRGREFIMKDAYSFDRDEAGADKSYRAMYEAYQQVFKRLGLRFRAVEADSGSIGGSFSHEFMVLADTGEDTIAACTGCEYAANVERAEVAAPAVPASLPAVGAIEEVPTPGKHTVEEVCAFLGVPQSALVKTLILVADGKPVAALVRGDRELNDVKLKNLLKCDELELATPELVQQVTGAPVGFAGPVGLNVERVFADHELLASDGWITGANKGDTHLRNVSLPRDARIERYADLRVITPADACPRCGQPIELTRGIEVGHVFKLGTKYSEPLKCTFLDEDGKEKVMVMGCYGIGVSRVVASCIEQNHDADGIVFPPPIAPFEAVLCCLDPKNGETLGKAEEFYAELKAQGVDVILDDRDERPGVKFKDADLVGMPLQLVVGGKGLARGIVEAKDRRTGEKTELPVEGFAEAFRTWRAAVRAGWGL
ncbi:proline--tRNA ligase [Nitratidesulfovibrio sp. SRB-5]|uniref:proline--tRNA ligase n=1 Tax=Nitratidesulfovibrio sp. SRB-5 TaxID=2872636 RepID=UPI001027DADA|nr:proline--tRNA ligase [Nitratidesulfovibrio sp. SRB-5]MBZ2171510.1 proline--tRNA ligase [Nitratidesulfovibrio sp. SRB-5]RXF78422.1 proline--tRNA ligase [Desulfovibrio sp. DS-1]